MLSNLTFRILLLTFALSSCATNRKSNDGFSSISDQRLSVFSVSFGKTGGFTNINPIYTIYSTGEVTKNPGTESDPVILKIIPSIKVDSVFLLLKETGFLKHPLNQPGNISHYIEFSNDTIQRKITWNDNGQLTPAILKLHNYLMLMIK